MIPGIFVMNEYRKRLGDRIPMFLLLDAGTRAVALFLPPEAAAAIDGMNAVQGLRAFEPSGKPEDDCNISVMFGTDSDLKRHFPATYERGRAHRN